MVFGCFVSMFSGMNSSAGESGKKELCPIMNVELEVWSLMGRVAGEGYVDHSPAELAPQSFVVSVTTQTCLQSPTDI